jgi:hypothetical protein
MRLIQKKGPFSKGSSFKVGGASLNEFVHVGIQIPKTQPMSPVMDDTIPFVGRFKYDMKSPNYSDDQIQDQYDQSKCLISDAIEPDVSIMTTTGTSDLYVNKAGVIEFDTNVGATVTIKFLKDLPAETIVDLVYKGVNE